MTKQVRFGKPSPMPKAEGVVLDNARDYHGAYTQGSRAYLKGREGNSNPHPHGSDLAEAWGRGYQDTRASQEPDNSSSSKEDNAS